MKSKEPLYHYQMDRSCLISPIIYKQNYKIVHVGGGPRHNHPYEINLNIYPMEGVDIVGDAENLPFEDNSVDVIISCAVLEHVENIEKVVEEINRVLKPNGLVYIEIPYMQHYHTHDVYGVKFEDYRRYTKVGLIRLFEKYIAPVKVGVCVGPVSTCLQMLHTLVEDIVDNKFIKKLNDFLYYYVGNMLVQYDGTLSDRVLENTRIPSGIFLFGMKKGEAESMLRQVGYPNSVFPKTIKYEMTLLENKDKLVLSVKNTSDTIWLCKSPVSWGEVHIGVQVLQHGEWNRDFERINLPKDVYPDDSITFSYTIPRDIVCDAVKFDLVAENVCWFEEFGNSPIKV